MEERVEGVCWLGKKTTSLVLSHIIEDKSSLEVPFADVLISLSHPSSHPSLPAANLEPSNQ